MVGNFLNGHKMKTIKDFLNANLTKEMVKISLDFIFLTRLLTTPSALGFSQLQIFLLGNIEKIIISIINIML
jgi:hypothetical protein